MGAGGHRGGAAVGIVLRRNRIVSGGASAFYGVNLFDVAVVVVFADFEQRLFFEFDGEFFLFWNDAGGGGGG